MTQNQTKCSSLRPRYQSDSRTDNLLRDLANVKDGGLGHFRATWNRFYARYTERDLLKLRDELRMLWSKKYGRVHPKPLSEAFESSPRLQVSLRTASLYRVWLSCPDVPLEGFICEHWLGLEKNSWLVVWRSGEKQIRANPRSLPAVLAWACVFHANHLFICRNIDCPAPYFIASRRDQKFCTEECASPAKKAAKLRWWHKNHRMKHENAKGSKSEKRGGKHDGTL
jgi:hypothetical protein